MTDGPAGAADRLVLLPAVDVAAGTAVRLVRGEAGTETTYGDPLAAARSWVDDGASGSTWSTSTRRSAVGRTTSCSRG